MLACSIGFIHLETDAQVVRTNLPVSKQGAQQRIFRLGDGVKWASAIEGIAEGLQHSLSTSPAAVFDLDCLSRLSRGDNAAAARFGCGTSGLVVEQRVGSRKVTKG